jgi:hypothetical protein
LHTWQENRQPKDVIKAHKLAQHMGISLHELLFGYEDRASIMQNEALPLTISSSVAGRYEVIVRRMD